MVSTMPVCPVCNSLAAVEKDCPKCGQPMVDAGVLQDYYDDYSAYLEQEIFKDGYKCSDDEHCVHLFACPHCHYDTCLRFRRLDEGRFFD